jgi:hypothetical protein
MNKRKPGRKSAAELGVKISALEVKRPMPPAELSHSEKETWNVVTKTKPADWFRKDTHPLLVAFCKHIEAARHIDRLLAGFRDQQQDEDVDFPDWLACLDKMLRARDRESRCLISLARSMRLSQQAMILPRGAGRQTANSLAIRLPHEIGKPWEDSD